MNVIKTKSSLLNAQKLLALFSLLALLSSTVSIRSRAQELADSNNPELHQALLDLTNPWTVMCVAAHPDDEDGTTLTVLRRKHGVHTVSLFSTYGEGGQNAVGPELYEELGVIRARETIKASEIQGSEPHFLGLKDFGFSKSSEETFRIWGHEEALRRIVLKLRELRPDVIITNHDTARGHGHHQATGQLILEAFDAAADPQRFPEQLSKVKPWQAQRLFVRIFRPNNPNDKAAAVEKVVLVDPNEIDPVRGTSFAEQALTALQQHATQGPWPRTLEELLKARGVSGKLAPIRYQLVREAAKAASLPSSASTLIDGLKPAAPLVALLRPPTSDDPRTADLIDEHDRMLDALRSRATGSASGVPAEEAHRLRLLDSRYNKALALAAGIALTISSDSVLVPGNETTFTINLSNTGSQIVTIKKLTFTGWGKASSLDAPEQLLPDTDTSDTVTLVTPASVKFTVPKAEHLYDGSLSRLPVHANAELLVEGAKFVVGAQFDGDVVPAVEIQSVSPSPCVRTEETLGQCKLLNVAFSNHLATPFRGTVTVRVAGGPTSRPYDVRRELVMGPLETRTEKLFAESPIPTQDNTRGLRSSGSAIISIFKNNELITERAVPIVYANARVASDLRVAYLPSFDETVERSLGALGVEAKRLTVEEIRGADLATYNTIIIDNRAYEAHPELIAANSRLLEFVNSGGTLIVFYHKSNEWNPDPKKNRPQLAPYPITLGDERVTDETAPVRFLQPRHPLLNFPNRIAQADFQDWIQERGLYYPKEWDRHYTPLFSMNDKGEQPLRGGLLVGKYGKGNYMYTSMVWYRQLRAGVPGGYRMFANMISYGHK
ncbi:MAG: PIG-L family deacetylase [Acidobacteriota bacterium]|nr:PIG-L family deacetylase [Acidobacteriota bacterium]